MTATGTTTETETETKTGSRYDQLQQRIDELNRTIETLEARRDELEHEQWGVLLDGEGHKQDDADAREAVATERSDKSVKGVINDIAAENEDGAPHEHVLEELVVGGEFGQEEIRDKLDSLKRRGEIYQPRTGHWRAT